MAALPFVKRNISFSAVGSYADGMNPSSTGKWLVPVDQSAPNGPQIIVRNDVTGDYDTRVYATGAAAVNLGCVAWNADDSRIYYGSSNNTVRYIKRTGNTFAFEAGFTVGSAPRGIDVHPTASNFILHVETASGTVKFTTHTDAGVATIKSNTSMPGTAEDCKFSPNGLLAAVSDRSGNVRIFTVDPVARTAAILQTIATGLGQAWSVSWSDDSQHLAVGFNTGISCAVYALVSGSWTRIAISDITTTFPAIPSIYISGGKLLLVQGFTASNWRVYERVGNSYVNRTADVTGYVPGEAYAGRASSNGGRVFATGGTTVLTVHDTPDMTALINVSAGMSMAPFTLAGSAAVANKLTGTLGMKPFTAAASVQFLYIQSTLSMSPMTSSALIAAEKDDVITTRPIVMASGSAMAEGLVPNITVDETPDPFIYGSPSMSAFTLAGALAAPLKITSIQSMKPFTAVGSARFGFKITSEQSMKPFAAAGEITVPNGRIISSMSMQPFSADGLITLPTGLSSVQVMKPFSAAGSGRFEFFLTASPSMKGFTASALVGYPVKVEAAGSLKPFSASGSAQIDKRALTGALSLTGFTVSSELDVPHAAIAAMSMKPFSAQGELLASLAVVPSNLSMKGFTLSGSMRRPWQLDANFSMKPFTSVGSIVFPLDNTTVMNMQPFTSVGALKQVLKVTGAMSMAPMEVAGEAEINIKVSSASSMAPFVADLDVDLSYKVNVAASMQAFSAEAELDFRAYDLTGEMSMAPFTTSANIKVLPRRRHLRIIIDT